MKLNEAKFLVDALEYAGESAELREDYSGRGMMGRTTCGVVYDHVALLLPAVLDFIKENEIPYDQIPEMGSLRTDNMGKGFIIY